MAKIWFTNGMLAFMVPPRHLCSRPGRPRAGHNGKGKHMKRTTLALAIVLVLGLTACSHQSNVTLKTRSANAANVATSSTLPEGATSSTSAQSPSTTISDSTTSSPAPTSTTVATDPLTTATPAITSALQSLGHTPAYAACVITQIGQQFTGTQLAFAIAVLSMASPTAAQTQAAVAATGISDADKADMPDNLHAVADTCASNDYPNG
jgi:hypothetical protein